MNKEVSFPIAQLLKEKGFNLKVVNFYNYERLSLVSDKDRKIDELVNYNPINWNSVKDHHTSAPTIAEVIMWLYEKYGIWIYITQSTARLGFRCFIQRLKVLGEVDIQNDERYTSPTEAYSSAIEYTLNNLI